MKNLLYPVRRSEELNNCIFLQMSLFSELRKINMILHNQSHLFRMVIHAATNLADNHLNHSKHQSLCPECEIQKLKLTD